MINTIKQDLKDLQAQWKLPSPAWKDYERKVIIVSVIVIIAVYAGAFMLPARWGALMFLIFPFPFIRIAGSVSRTQLAFRKQQLTELHDEWNRMHQELEEMS